MKFGSETDCISFFGGLPRDIHKHVLKKIIGGGQGKKNVQPGKAELKDKVAKHANAQINCI
jgi:hypothetical protein